MNLHTTNILYRLTTWWLMLTNPSYIPELITGKTHRHVPVPSTNGCIFIRQIVLGLCTMYLSIVVILCYGVFFVTLGSVMDFNIAIKTTHLFMTSFLVGSEQAFVWYQGMIDGNIGFIGSIINISTAAITVVLYLLVPILLLLIVTVAAIFIGGAELYDRFKQKATANHWVLPKLSLPNNETTTFVTNYAKSVSQKMCLNLTFISEDTKPPKK